MKAPSGLKGLTTFRFTQKLTLHLVVSFMSPGCEGIGILESSKCETLKSGNCPEHGIWNPQISMECRIHFRGTREFGIWNLRLGIRDPLFGTWNLRATWISLARIQALCTRNGVRSTAGELERGVKRIPQVLTVRHFTHGEPAVCRVGFFYIGRFMTFM